MNFNEQFKNNFLTQGNSWSHWYNMLMFNAPFESLSQIKSLLKNNPELPIASCVVYIDKPTLITLKHAIRILETEQKPAFFSPEYTVYSTYLNTAVTKAFMEAGCIKEGTDGLTLKELENYLKAFSSTNPKTISKNPLLMLPVCFTFNDFDKKEELSIIAEDALPKELQRQINELIKGRSLHIKFWTTQDGLSTYKTPIGNYIEATHDYISYDLNQEISENDEQKEKDRD